MGRSLDGWSRFVQQRREREESRHLVSGIPGGVGRTTTDADVHSATTRVRVFDERVPTSGFEDVAIQAGRGGRASWAASLTFAPRLVESWKQYEGMEEHGKRVARSFEAAVERWWVVVQSAPQGPIPYSARHSPVPPG